MVTNLVASRINISSHLSSDLSHIMILKHISALARTLCDTLKMIAAGQGIDRDRGWKGL
jgi:hypothetical protein